MGYKHNKEDIVLAGSQLFRKQGYHNVGINDILKSCNIPKGSFYNFFESKEDFAAQVIEQYSENSIAYVKSLLEKKASSPLARIKGMYKQMIQDNIAEGCSQGCLIGNLSVELGGTNDRLSTHANEKFMELIKVIGSVIEEAQEKGEIKAEQDPHELAEYLHSGFFGALTRMKVNRNPVYLNKWLKLTFGLIKS
ncbi:MAG: TetR/AcrR family transcriptional regulator [Bacteroidota bacterium]